jgi:hypothetical protein
MMKNRHPWLKFRGSWLLAITTAMIATPIAAQTANFGTLKLSPGFTTEQGTASGYTGGAYSLSAVSNQDKDKNKCFGFGDPKPDHILVLEQDFKKLTILIDSGGKDTTLLIKGPDEQTIRCGDDTGRSKDASVSDRNWKKGIYQMWIGTFNRGDKHNYTLKVEEK